MHDHRLTELFRTLETGIEFAEPESAFADALFGRLQAEARPARWSRPMVLLVAALITAALAAGLAIGSGLIELPSQEDTLLPVHGLDCPPAESLPEGVILQADVGALDDTGRPGSRLTVYEDGTVLVGPEYADPYAAEPFPALADGGSVYSHGQLSATGIERVRTAVAESGLLARGCHLDLLASTPLRGISVRSADGAYAETHWGQYGGFIRVITVEEGAAAATLVARLEELGAWLPSEAWIEQGPQSFADELWLLTTERISPELSYQSDRDPSAIPQAALARDFVLPGGDKLLTFGAAWSEPDIQPSESEVHFDREGRCAVYALPDARLIYRSLQALNGRFTNGRWWLADEGDWIAVGLRPLIPPDRECSPRVIGIFDPSAPTPSARPELGGSSLAVDPCSLLPEDLVSDALGFEPPYRMAAQREDNFSGSSSYLTCHYIADGSDPGNSLTVAVRRVATTAARAPELARMWLGEGFDDTINGAPVWLNGCMTSSPLSSNTYCRAVVAVYAEPYFVLIEANSFSVQGGSAVPNGEEVARSLIPLLLGSLSELQGRK